MDRVGNRDKTLYVEDEMGSEEAVRAWFASDPPQDWTRHLQGEDAGVGGHEAASSAAQALH